MVTCGGLDCSVCSLLELVQNMFNWLLGLSATIAVIAVIYAGFNFLLNNGDLKLLKRSKNYLKYAIFGFVFILLSFWIFNAIYLTLGANNKASWFKIDCIQERAFIEKKDQGKTSDQTVWTNNLGLAIVGGSSIYGAINDSQKVIKLDLANFDANNLLLDALKLNPEQVVYLISTDKSLSFTDVISYINSKKGYEVPGVISGDRMAANPTEKEVLEIRNGAQGAISALYEGQEIAVDPGDGQKMKEFQNFLKNALAQIKAEGGDVYAFNGTTQEVYSWNNQDSCEAGGGLWKTFANECKARESVCGQGNLQCSDIRNELSGCQCPKDSCLRFGKCVEVTSNPDTDSADSDEDGVLNSLDYCPKTPKGEKVDRGSNSNVKGCSCSQITLQTRKCPATRCEGLNLVRYSENVKDKCLNGKIIKDPCNPTRIEYNKQCNELKDVSQVNDLKQMANQGVIKDWINNLDKAINGRSNIPRPNDSLNNWEKTGTDEGGAPPPSGSGTRNQGKSPTGQSPDGTGSTDSSGTQTGPTNTDAGNSTGGSEEARALEQKLVRIPEGLLANNKGVAPYVINECIPKIQQAAVELDKLRPGWKLYPSSIYRSDQKQTAMWDRSSQNEKMIARPKARGGRGSQHSSGNALDLKFQNSNRQIISMSSQDKALLRQVMESAGMIPYNAEWWHFYCIKPFRF